MTAFDTAWALVKAPLDMDSIKEVPNEWEKDLPLILLTLKPTFATL